MNRITEETKKRTLKVIIIAILLFSIANIGVSLDQEEQLNPDKFEMCYEEGGITYCYMLSTQVNIPIKFTKNLECYSETDEACSGNCSEVVGGCGSQAEIMEKKSIEAKIRKFKSKESFQTIYENVTLEKGEKIDLVISSDEVNYSKCGKPTISNPGLISGSPTYTRNCTYKGETYDINVSYAGSGLFVNDMWKPKKAEILPSLPNTIQLILITIIITVAIWILYPKLRKREKKKNK